MKPEKLLHSLSVAIYEEPLLRVRNEEGYPNMDSPLHVLCLIIDCDTEISMDSILGYLENSNGRHLTHTVAALREIGAAKTADVLDSVCDCMRRHSVTWERLRADFSGTAEYEISSWNRLHGEALASFAQRAMELTRNFEVLNPRYSPDDAYAALLDFVQKNQSRISNELEQRGYTES